MKRWKLPLAAFLFMLICVVLLYFSHRRVEPRIAQVIDPPVKPKLTRPVRKCTARSGRAKEMVAKTDGGDAAAVKPYGCLLKSTYDETTGILRQEIDSDCDGVAEQCRVEELNEYGEPVRVEHYKDCGREPSNCHEIEYNEYGEEIAWDFDTDCDGSVDSCLSIKRNDHGDEIEEIFDEGCDGELDKVEVITNKGGKGVLISGDEHLCYAYVYDEDDLVIEKKVGNCGEEPDYCSGYEYDLAAGVRRRKWDNNCDGTVDSCQVVVYRDGYKYPFSFTENNCDRTWKHCMIWGEVDWVGGSLFGHEACAKKYEEFVKENQERR